MARSEIDCRRCPIGQQLKKDRGIPLHGPTEEGKGLSTPEAQRACILAGIGFCEVLSGMIDEELKELTESAGKSVAEGAVRAKLIA